jgi:hypothetical protein
VTVKGPRDAVHAVKFVPTVRQELVMSDTAGQVVPLDTVGLGVQVEPELVRIVAPMVPVAPPPVDTVR